MTALEAPSKIQRKNGFVVPLYEKILVGMGSLTNFYGNSGVNAIAITFYQMMLHVNPAVLGVALAIPRLWDAFTDPLMGNISDNFKSRFGRRRPFIFAGAALMAVTFGIIWMVPLDWSENAKVGWLLVTSLLFFTSFTVFSVPYQGLTYELTPNYDERTSVMGHVTVWIKAGAFSYQWVVPLALLLVSWGWFSSEESGIRFVAWGIGLFVLFGVGILPALFAKERYYKISSVASKTPFWEGLSVTFKNRAFLVLLGLALLQVIAGMLASNLDYYLLVYYMFDGDLVTGAFWKGILSSGYALCGFMGIPIVYWWSKRTTKKKVFAGMYWLFILNSIFRWFIYTPGNHWFILIDPILGSVFWIGVGMVQPSMMADVCDQDELRYGKRREGMFGSVYGWFMKTAMSLSVLAGGLALNLAGFNAELGGEQQPDTFLKIRLAMVLGGVVPSLLGLWLLRYYPISREAAEDTSKQLEARRGAIG